MRETILTVIGGDGVSKLRDDRYWLVTVGANIDSGKNKQCFACVIYIYFVWKTSHYCIVATCKNIRGKPVKEIYYYVCVAYGGCICSPHLQY